MTRSYPEKLSERDRPPLSLLARGQRALRAKRSKKSARSTRCEELSHKGSKKKVTCIEHPTEEDPLRRTIIKLCTSVEQRGGRNVLWQTP